MRLGCLLLGLGLPGGERIVALGEQRLLLAVSRRGLLSLRRIGDESVDREQQRLGLALLVVDLLGDALEIAEPLSGVGVACLLCSLQLGREVANGACDLLELALKLLDSWSIVCASMPGIIAPVPQ